MKLLLDQNISYKLVDRLDVVFPGTQHVYKLGLHKASDEEVWNYARDNDFVVVTNDSDFNEMSIVYGSPPKIVWLRVGNASTKSILDLLIRHKNEIFSLEKEENLTRLQIYG